jgi:hypothetical protein
MKLLGGLPIVIGGALASVAAWIVVASLFVATCTPGWNDPHPVTPEPGLPCGRIYHVCPKTGGCCASDETCGVEGHACGLNDCCFVGEGVMAKRKHPQGRPPAEGGAP